MLLLSKRLYLRSRIFARGVDQGSVKKIKQEINLSEGREKELKICCYRSFLEKEVTFSR